MASIVVVDDDEEFQDIVARVLRSAGHRVVTAGSAEEALRTIDQLEAVDLVLLDLVMPGMSPRALCAALRADRALRHVRVLLVTGRPDAAEVARELDVAGYVTKPLDFVAFVARVRELTGSNAEPA